MRAVFIEKAGGTDVLRVRQGIDPPAPKRPCLRVGNDGRVLFAP